MNIFRIGGERVMVTYYIYIIGLFHFQAKFVGNMFYGYRHNSHTQITKIEILIDL
jgi:hypothetical protein